MTTPTDGWDVVHTVNDYFDGPRIGIANFDGSPHIYTCVWDAAADDWEDTFYLTPIREEDLAFVMEDWAIWCRWNVAHDEGRLAAADQHPTLAEDRIRHEELKPLVDAILKSGTPSALLAIPEFAGSMKPFSLRVRWKRA